MKLGVNSWFSKKLGVEKSLRKIADLDFHAVEIAGLASYFREARKKKLRRLLRKGNLHTISVSAGVPFMRNPDALNLHSPKDHIRRQSVRYIFRCIDMASYLEGDLVYICSVRKELAMKKAKLEETFSESLAACAEYADKSGLKVAIEHFPGGEVPSLDAALDIISKMGLKNLGVLLDTGHLKLSGDSMRTAVARAQGSIVHVQIDNNDGLLDKHWPPQEGTITRDEYAAFFQSITRSGYRGYLSLELANLEDVDSTVEASRSYLESLP